MINRQEKMCVHVSGGAKMCAMRASQPVQVIHAEYGYGRKVILAVKWPTDL